MMDQTVLVLMTCLYIDSPWERSVFLYIKTAGPFRIVLFSCLLTFSSTAATINFIFPCSLQKVFTFYYTNTIWGYLQNARQPVNRNIIFHVQLGRTIVGINKI